MYKQLKDWADTYDTITHEEELELLDSGLSDNDIIEGLLKGNARLILKTASRWGKTYGYDDAASIAIKGAILAYSKWNPDYRFGILCQYYMSMAFRKDLKRYESNSNHIDITDIMDMDDLSCQELTILAEDYDDGEEVMLDMLESILTVKEFQFIKDIYWNDYTTLEAGRNYGYISAPAISVKKGKILNKIKKHLETLGDFEDYAK